MFRQAFAFVVVAGTLACGPLAHAQTPVFAVLSALGDNMNLIVRQPQIGSSLRHSAHEILPVPAQAIDRAALASASDLIEGSTDDKNPVLIGLQIPGLYAPDVDVLAVIDQSNQNQKLRELLEQQHVTDLIVILKGKSDAHFSDGRGNYEGAKIEGVGFYMDNFERYPGAEPHTQAGYLAPYAYVRVVRINVATMSVTRESNAQASNLIWVHDGPAFVPWDVLTAQQKLAALQQLTGKAVNEAVAQVVS